MDFLEVMEEIDFSEVDVEHQIAVVSLSPNIRPVRMDLLSMKEYVASYEELQAHIDDEGAHLPDVALVTHSQDGQAHVNRTAWVNMTLENGWTQIAGKRVAAYKILATGVVVFKGRISGASSTSTTFFTLPVGSRPGGVVDMVAWGDGTATLLNIASTGACSCPVSGINALSLENVFFAV